MGQKGRPSHGRALRQLLIGGGVLAALALLSALIPTNFLARRLTVASAYVGLGLICLTLAIGPGYLLRGRRPPVSISWRRDLGIWAGGISLFHVLVGFQVHFGGNWARYFFHGAEAGQRIPLRADAIGWANHTGLLATLILVLLVAISSNVAIRRLGPARWKSLQRLNYAGLVLVGVHGAIYQVLVRRPIPAVALLSLLLTGAVAFQVAGYLIRRRAEAEGSRPASLPPRQDSNA